MVHDVGGCPFARSLPFGEAWIEMRPIAQQIECNTRRFPSGKRGLKYRTGGRLGRIAQSLPFGEAWIEITNHLPRKSSRPVASLRGSVD